MLYGQVGSSCPGEATSVYTLRIISTIAILVIKISSLLHRIDVREDKKGVGILAHMGLLSIYTAITAEEHR